LLALKILEHIEVWGFFEINFKKNSKARFCISFFSI
jgi:hypothetical protein